MDLFEYQARDMFEKHGVPVLGGAVAETPEEARAAAERLLPEGGGRVVVKAQVKTGGRGKAGGVKLADSVDDAEEKAGQILGMDIKGHTVHRVMLAPAAAIEEEYYFSVLLDRANRTYLAMASREGGMEIEQLAVEKPEALARVPVDALEGIDEAKAREIAEKGGFPEDVRDQVADAVQTLWGLFVAEDATLVEVNPLVKTVRRAHRRAGRQGDPGRQRRLPPPRPRRAGGPALRRPARGEGEGEGPQLRQARRLGRHHRQRCRAGDVDAGRRGLRRRAAQVDGRGSSRPTSSTSAAVPRPR